MKKLLSIACLLLMTASVSGTNIDGKVSWESANIHRGETLNDGPVVQSVFWISTESPWTFQFWGNLDIGDFNNTLDEGEFSEIRMTAVYRIPTELIDIRMGYTEYWYPGIDKETSREVGINIGSYAGPFEVYIQPSYMLDGDQRESWYINMGMDVDLKLHTLKTSIGYVDNRSDVSHGFSFYSVEIVKPIKNHFELTITYVGQIDDKVLLDANGPGTYEVEWVGAIAYNF